jgi:error-prone DNA polymerase
MANTVWGSGGRRHQPEARREAGMDATDPRLALALELSAALIGFPRHLSQHVGGFVLTAGRLDELVPIQNAAMQDRTVIEWDKDDLDALKIYKVDVLALGMLTALRKSFEMIKSHYGEERGLDMPTDDDKVYEMLCKADSVGVFQVESRAQMSMLPAPQAAPLLRPCGRGRRLCGRGRSRAAWCIPYLRNREVPEDQIAYPSDKLEKILRRTRGVPAVPGTGDADRDRLRGLPAGQGRQAAARHGDVSAIGHDPQAEGRLHQRHAGNQV